jgi:rfaE bifunctional protein nucleotidyltransferase chain/domain
VLRDKIKPLSELVEIRETLKKQNLKVVFTNGVFDILHRGHVEYLDKAKSMGDVLMVGLNSDKSVRMVKGEGKPIVCQEDRAVVLAGLSSVDYISYFDEETPHHIISSLLPDILVKGGDYNLDQIVGRDVVEATGGRVITIPLTPGSSTSDLIRKVGRLIKERKILL